ncbi:MAG: methyltransferase domain-containing protein [Saprospiraceae bacterium]
MGLSSLRSERFDYVSREVDGYCLDVGCGKHNLFITNYYNGHGTGIDVFQYEGLKEDNIIKDATHFPFEDNVYNTVTLIANINHIPIGIRDIELAEIYRCTVPGGKIVVTMGHPLAEILVHKLVFLYDTLFGTNVDMDTERGMQEGESYFLTDKAIKGHLLKAQYQNIRKKYFLTQWGLNHLFVGYKRVE